jgi:uncharacterized protein (TIGR03437 family)
MTQKYTSALTLVFAGAATAFAQITLNSVPSRSVGSPCPSPETAAFCAQNITSTNPNLVEGREFYNPQSVALDTSVTPNILYVSDTQNNRVLAWKNATSYTNGQVADLAIGQPNLFTTFPGGPSGGSQTGLYQPTGIAVDAHGNLYVADSGNNRILRYPTPFAQTSQYPLPDLWIGQATLNTRAANYNGQATPNAQGIYLTNGTSVLYQSSITFDGSGNLWMSDAGNRRVLEFAASALTAGGGAAATLALGQKDLVSLQTALPNTAASELVTTQFLEPDGLGFDPNGNLFVTDFINVSGSNFSRVMVFTPPFSTGQGAGGMMGVFPTSYVFPTDPAAHQALLDSTILLSPSSVFFITGSTPAVGVVDSGSSRILLFAPFGKWPSGGIPPQATSIYGQPNATCPAQQTTLPAYAACRYPNNGNPAPSATTLALPGGAVLSPAGTDLFVADSSNNRVLDIPVSGNTLASAGATRVLGQDLHNGNFDTNSINLIEGREFQFLTFTNSGTLADSAIAVDASTGTPHLWVADPGNNRVLGFKDVRSVTPGATADVVIGQPDGFTARCNYHASGDTTTGPTKSNLCRPVGLLVDQAGNLYVADSLNGRVLRFPSPFAYTGSAPEPADLVLGQQNFTTTITDPTASSMLAPYGLAFTPSCNLLQSAPCTPNGLLVSDEGDNRVLYIPMTNGGFTAGNDNGKAATIVFGQQGFNSIAPGNTTTGMNSPRGISCDTSGYLYVADTGNNRVLVFNNPAAGTTQSGEAASPVIGNLNSPQGVFVNPQTGEIWVANSNAGSLVRYASLTAIQLGSQPLLSFPEVYTYNGNNFGLAPLAVTQDQYGALYVADTANRVVFYYAGLSACNGATFMAAFAAKAPNLCAPFDTSNNTLNPHPLAPLVLGTLFPCTNCAGDQFGDVTGQWDDTYPMKTTLNDIEVTVDGVPAPLYYVGAPIGTAHPSGQINFVVPNGARTSGYADVEVVKVSTGQVLGATLVPMAAASPGLLICYNANNNAPFRGACVLNQDNSVNGPNNPALRGSVIQIYATGQGYVPNAPPDGSAPGAVNSPAALTVYLNAIDVNGYGEAGQHLLYNGLQPQFPGVWQINVQIPQGVAPSSTTTNYGGGTLLNLIVNGAANIDLGLGWNTIIWVK